VEPVVVCLQTSLYMAEEKPW